MTKKYVSLEHAIRNAVRDQQYKKKPLNEDFEFEMARNELRTAIDAAKRLMAQLDGEGDLEAWVQSKITKGADYLDTVADYMDSRDTKKLKEETKEIMEALDDIGDDRKKQANVGRLNTPTTHNKKVQVRTKIIDEAKSLKNVVKSIIKDKKEEKESGGANPLVDFNPKLTKITDGAMVKEELGLTDDQIKQNAGNTRQRAAAVKAQQIANAKANAEMEAKFQKGEISKDDLEKHYKGDQGQVASLAPGVKVANKVEKTSDDQIVDMTRGAETVADYSPSAVHQVAQAGLKAASGDTKGAVGNLAAAAVAPVAKLGAKAYELARGAKAGIGKYVAGATTGGAALAAPELVKADDKPQEGQAEVQKPTVTTSSPPPTPTPPKPAETPKPAVPAPSSSAAPPTKPQKYSGTISQFQKEHPGATVGQAMNAIQGKTAIAGGKNDVAQIGKRQRQVYDPNAEKPAPEPHPNATQNTSNPLPSQDQPPAPAKIEKDSPAPPKQNDELPLPTFQTGAESGGKTKKKVNESALINAFIQYYKNYK